MTSRNIEKGRTDVLIREANIAVDVAASKEEWAVRAFRMAYDEKIKRVQEGDTILYATEDGWDKGPLPYAIEFIDLNVLDGDDDAWAVLLFRDGGPTCDRFLMQDAMDTMHGAVTQERGMLNFVRQITHTSGKIAFLDGHQAAGLLLAAGEKEGWWRP